MVSNVIKKFLLQMFRDEISKITLHLEDIVNESSNYRNKSNNKNDSLKNEFYYNQQKIPAFNRDSL
jgi:hypothetical protein